MYTTPILRKDLLVGSEFEDLSKIKTVDDYTKVLKYLTENKVLQHLFNVMAMKAS